MSLKTAMVDQRYSRCIPSARYEDVKRLHYLIRAFEKHFDPLQIRGSLSLKSESNMDSSYCYKLRCNFWICA